MAVEDKNFNVKARFQVEESAIHQSEVEFVGRLTRESVEALVDEFRETLLNMLEVKDRR